MAELVPGVYDRLVDEWLTNQGGALEAKRLTATLAEVDPAELPDRVGEVVGEWVRSTLAGIRTDDRATLAVVLTDGGVVAARSRDERGVAR